MTSALEVNSPSQAGGRGFACLCPLLSEFPRAALWPLVTAVSELFPAAEFRAPKTCLPVPLQASEATKKDQPSRSVTGGPDFHVFMDSCPALSLPPSAARVFSSLLSSLRPCFMFPPFTQALIISPMLLPGGLALEAGQSSPPSCHSWLLPDKTDSMDKMGTRHRRPFLPFRLSLPLQTLSSLPSRRSPRCHQCPSLRSMPLPMGSVPVLSQVVMFLYCMCQLLTPSGPVESTSYKSQVNGSVPTLAPVLCLGAPAHPSFLLGFPLLAPPSL